MTGSTQSKRPRKDPTSAGDADDLNEFEIQNVLSEFFNENKDSPVSESSTKSKPKESGAKRARISPNTVMNIKSEAAEGRVLAKKRLTKKEQRINAA